MLSDVLSLYTPSLKISTAEKVHTVPVIADVLRSLPGSHLTAPQLM